MAYFHILIELKAQGKYQNYLEESDMDIPAEDKSKILTNIFIPYVSGIDFIFKGLTLTKDDVRRLLITSSEKDTRTIIEEDKARQHVRGAYMVSVLHKTTAAFSKTFATDVTLDFINEAKSVAVPVAKEQNTNDLLPHLHEKIREVSYQKYKDKHYADAVESAFKEINDRLKKLYRKHKGTEADGNDLFAKTFNDDPNTTLLKVDDLLTGSGKDEQAGYRFLLMGAWSSQRNPKAHANLYISEDEAYDRLILASMLMKRIDKAITYTFAE